MADIFRVYAANGPSRAGELELPASDYELLDLMERLGLESGQAPYLEISESHRFDFLAEHLHELPDICQLNSLARVLDALNGDGAAAFEGLLGMALQRGEKELSLLRLMDFAHSVDCCHVVEDVMTDYELGRFCAENGFVPEAETLSDEAFALLDFTKIGREHREQTGGVFTSLGYVEQHTEPRHAGGEMDFRPRKPAYTILLHMAALPLTGPIRQEDILQLRLPAPEEQVRETLGKLGGQKGSGIVASIWDCAIPRLNHQVYFEDVTPRLLELSQCLLELDGRGDLPKYKALLEAEDCVDLAQMIALAGTVDAYLFQPETRSAEDVAREELRAILCGRDAETLLPHINLRSYGRALLERNQAVVTEYGLLERVDGQSIRQTQEQPRRGGMAVM